MNGFLRGVWRRLPRAQLDVVCAAWGEPGAEEGAGAGAAGLGWVATQVEGTADLAGLSDLGAARALNALHPDLIIELVGCRPASGEASPHCSSPLTLLSLASPLTLLSLSSPSPHRSSPLTLLSLTSPPARAPLTPARAVRWYPEQRAGIVAHRPARVQALYRFIGPGGGRGDDLFITDAVSLPPEAPHPDRRAPTAAPRPP